MSEQMGHVATLPQAVLDLNTANPMLSILIVVRNERDRVQKTIRSILDQDVIDRIEVLIVDCASDDKAVPIPGSDHRAVRVIRIPDAESLGEAKARGVHLARAPIVAFLEEHVYVLPGWAAAVARAHAGPWAAVGGEVTAANPNVGISNATAQMCYFRWMAPAKAGEHDYLPLHNTSYRRDVLLTYGDRLAQLLLAEFAFQKLLLADGYKFYFDPAIRWVHLMETSLGSAAKGTFLISRATTAVRADESQWSLLEKAARIAFAPAIPFYRVFKDLAWVVRNRRERTMAYVRAVPVTFALFCVSVVAQTVGLLWGTGSVDQQFLSYESEAYRQSSEDRASVKAPRVSSLLRE